VSFEVAVLAYAVAVAATWVPFLPSGFGLVELAVPAMLHHFGVPTASGLAAVLIWRGVAFFLAALGGTVAYLALRLTRPTLDLPAVSADSVDPGFDPELSTSST
jgi:hypothetical protein